MFIFLSLRPAWPSLVASLFKITGKLWFKKYCENICLRVYLIVDFKYYCLKLCKNCGLKSIVKTCV